MYTTIYRPSNIDEFIGNNNVINSFEKWILKWDSNDKKNKCALVSGLCGIGKSLLVDLILQKHKYNIVNVTLGDDRNKEYMKNVIKPLIKTPKTFNGQPNALVASDIDCGNDYGFITSLTEFIKDTKIPIICICNNKYDQTIKPILNHCFDIKLMKPSYQEMFKLARNIIITEKIKIKETEFKELYNQSNGDIRFILNTLQFGLRKSSKNIQSSNIFDTTTQLLSMDETFDRKYNTYWLCNDLQTLMIQENYVYNTFDIRDVERKNENVSYSADMLSDSDLFETFVNMTHWEIAPYVATSTISATLKCNKKTMIKFPQFLGKTSIMYKNKKDNINYENLKLSENKLVFAQTEVTRVKKLKASTSKKSNVMIPKKEKEKEEPKQPKQRGRPKKIIIID